MEGRGNLEFVALFPVPGSRRSHGRVRHIAHIPKCQFRTPVSEALTMNNFFFAATAAHVLAFHLSVSMLNYAPTIRNRHGRREASRTPVAHLHELTEDMDACRQSALGFR